MSDYFDLGTYARNVTTESAHARLWVNRGLVWAYAFNHEEAAACFERAIGADPGCALAHWGLAYALGPNYNKPWEAFDEADLSASVSRAFTASRAAIEAATVPVERALAHALAARYPRAEPPAAHAQPPAGNADVAAWTADANAWNRQYADAMRSVYRDFPDDLDVAALFADALMNLTPWALWDTKTGESAEGSATLEAKAVLDRAIETGEGRQHPGLLHLFIHLMEMSASPEDALQAAELLRDLVPDAGHLRHMPTHLDVLCGDYRRVVACNTAAIKADEKFAEARGAMNFYTLYRAHNIHFKIYGAMFLGQQRTALEAADQLAAAIPAELLEIRVPPMADWLEGFVPMRMHVLIRFGRWQDIIDTPLPADQDLYCVTTAMTHYAKGIAHAATGRLDNARDQRALFKHAQHNVPPSRTVFNNTCQDILTVAEAMLDGEIAYREGSYENAFARLRQAVERDDGLPYDEPWGWMQPARHALGALLLEQGHVAEAEAVYRADLGLDDTLPRGCQHPANVWSLHGYHECLTRLGKHELAGVVAQQLKVVAAHADVPITASCYCRLTALWLEGVDGAGRAAVNDPRAGRDAVHRAQCGTLPHVRAGRRGQRAQDAVAEAGVQQAAGRVDRPADGLTGKRAVPHRPAAARGQRVDRVPDRGGSVQQVDVDEDLAARAGDAAVGLLVEVRVPQQPPGGRLQPERELARVIAGRLGGSTGDRSVQDQERRGDRGGRRGPPQPPGRHVKRRDAAARLRHVQDAAASHRAGAEPAGRQRAVAPDRAAGPRIQARHVAVRAEHAHDAVRVHHEVGRELRREAGLDAGRGHRPQLLAGRGAQRGDPHGADGEYPAARRRQRQVAGRVIAERPPPHRLPGRRAQPVDVAEPVARADDLPGRDHAEHVFAVDERPAPPQDLGRRLAHRDLGRRGARRRAPRGGQPGQRAEAGQRPPSGEDLPRSAHTHRRHTRHCP